MYGWNDNSVMSLFNLLKGSLLSIENSVPDSYSATGKIPRSVRMEYASIHACPNDCVLCRKQHATLTKCPKCGTDRYCQDLQASNVPTKFLLNRQTEVMAEFTCIILWLESIV